MTTQEYLHDLRNRGLQIRLDGDDLRITAPRKLLTPGVQKKLKERKSELVEILREESSRRGPPSLEPAGDLSPAPLSFAQERMWFLDRMEPGSTAYNRPYAFLLTGALDPAALEWSLREILRRHETLRSRFRLDGDDPVQEVGPVPDTILRRIELSGRDPGDEEVREMLEDEAQAPFDLEEGPLARFLLIRLSEGSHVFIHNIHHSVSDGWSTGVFHEELGALYAHRLKDGEASGGASGGDEEPVAPLPVQYPDYARWQREWLTDPVMDGKLDYWRGKLGGDLPVLELPLDRPRPPVQTYRGARETARLPGELGEAARELAREERSTIFMVLFAAYASVLHRYSGQEDIPIGTPVAGRQHSKVERLIGLFINTVVLRTDLSGDPTFREMIHRVRGTALEAMEHQEVPFEKVVEALRPERSVSHHPLFQVLFTFHDLDDRDLRLPGLEVRPLHVDRGSTYMDLDLTVSEKEDGLDVYLRYNTDLFEGETARRLLDHFGTLLAGAVEDPDRRVSQLPLLTPEERRTIVGEWNDTDADLGTPRPVHRLIEEQAERTPDRIAVTTSSYGASEEVAYGELLERAESLAGRLRSHGVGPGTLVGVATDRTPGMLVAVLAVLKAGGAYLPVDPSLPPERIRFMLDDAGAPVVVADQEGRSALPPLEAVRVEIDAAGRVLEEGAAGTDPAPSANGAEPRREPTADDLAYTIYTSGSTGRPKGVELAHRNVFNFIGSMARSPGLDEDDVVLAVTTLSFDIHVLELLLPLTVGARIVLADGMTAADGRSLRDAIREQGVTLLQATPATWRLLLEAGWEGEEPLRVLSGGEALPPDLARSLTARSQEVWNLYGPTETTVWSARYRLPPEGEPVLIGRPIENTRIYVLDRAGNPVPVGAPGELFIGGAGVARGYHDRPDLNGERFLADPFSGEDGARMYRTGDRVRWRPGGILEFLGRMDHQVKIRGFRIELGEIETVLSELPEIEEAVTAVREDRVDDKRLVAYVVFRPGRSLTASEIRKRLLEKLPDYMVPALVVEMEELPLTPNGKVDRNALPDPLSGGLSGNEEFAEPSTDAERMVADIWKDLLSIEKVGRRDNFFDLGGHSLLSMRAVHRIEERTGRTLNPRIMILNTLEQIAADVGGNGNGSDAR